MVNCFISKFTVKLQFYVSSFFFSEALIIPSDSNVLALIIKEAATIKQSVIFMFPYMVAKIGTLKAEGILIGQ